MNYLWEEKATPTFGHLQSISELLTEDAAEQIKFAEHIKFAELMTDFLLIINCSVVISKTHQISPSYQKSIDANTTS